MRYLGLLILGLAALLGLSFAMLNSRPVLFDYYLGSQEFPLSLLLVASLLLGIMVGMLAMLPSLIRQKFENRRLRRLSK